MHILECTSRRKKCLNVSPHKARVSAFTSTSLANCQDAVAWMGLDSVKDVGVPFVDMTRWPSSLWRLPDKDQTHKVEEQLRDSLQSGPGRHTPPGRRTTTPAPSHHGSPPRPHQPRTSYQRADSTITTLPPAFDYTHIDNPRGHSFVKNLTLKGYSIGSLISSSFDTLVRARSLARARARAHTHTHTHTHTYTHTRARARAPAHTHARTHTHIHTHSHAHTHMHARTHTHTYIHSHTLFTQTRTFIRIWLRARAHARTHTHIHTLTHA